MTDQQTLSPVIFVLGRIPLAASLYARLMARILTSCHSRPTRCRQELSLQASRKEIPEVQHVIMSDLLRAEMAKPDSPWAQEIQAKMPLGVHVNSEVSTGVLQAWYKSLPQDHTKTYLLDGFPRNIEQAEAFLAKVRLDANDTDRVC